MPMFRPDTQTNLEKGVLMDTDKKYIVQTLATILIHQCGLVAKVLVRKYSFIKDGCNLELLRLEQLKTKPRADVLKQLLACIFPNR